MCIRDSALRMQCSASIGPYGSCLPSRSAQHAACIAHTTSPNEFTKVRHDHIRGAAAAVHSCRRSNGAVRKPRKATSESIKESSPEATSKSEEEGGTFQGELLLRVAARLVQALFGEGGVQADEVCRVQKPRRHRPPSALILVRAHACQYLVVLVRENHISLHQYICIQTLLCLHVQPEW